MTKYFTKISESFDSASRIRKTVSWILKNPKKSYCIIESYIIQEESVTISKKFIQILTKLDIN